MITYIDGHFYTSPAQVLVNTVNIVGVMGKGLAKEFKQIYPEMFKIYQELCESGNLQIGKLFLYKSPNKWILNFPTKKHWRFPSKPEYIEAGLIAFRKTYSNMGINSIAFPALGCGNGELDFDNQVKPLMEKYLANLPISIFIYPHRHSYNLPEHIDPKSMKEWLRSEPHLLSFSEVWEDIATILKTKNVFYTLVKQNKFEAELAIWQNEDVLKIISSNNTLNIYKNDILDFWQQLRRHGFITSMDVPSGVGKRVSYLAPIFNELPYVKSVRLSSNKKYSSVLGLQFFEPMVDSKKTEPSQVHQLSLF